MEFQNKKVLVFGSGKSGCAAMALLKKVGAQAVLYDGNDKLDPSALREKLQEKTHDPAYAPEIILGEYPEEKLNWPELLVLSPGVPCDLPLVETFRQAGIPVIGEIELAYLTGKGKVLAITGTNGKTTSTTLLGEIMKASFPEVYVVGNIGNPYTDIALSQSGEAVTVAEISSFQLETIRTFHPAVSAVTNLTPDHLNRHHTLEEYYRVKMRIAENQTEEDLCVLNYEDPVLREYAPKLHCRICWFSSQRKLDEGLYYENGTIYLADASGRNVLIKTDELQILGLHNFENVMTAAAMALDAGADIKTIRRVLRDFPGVEHRIEFVEEIDGVRYYNDSKGTNPDAAIKAIQAMNRPTLLIGGGYDKGSEYDEWINSFDGKVRRFVLIGQTKEKIAQAAVRCGFPKEDIVLCEDLAEAVSVCRAQSRNGDAVLLSPACASWGQFDNYEQRGEQFKLLIREKDAGAGAAG